MVTPLLGSTFLFICLYISLGICLSGVIIRIFRWFTVDTGPARGIPSPRRRIYATVKAIITSLFSIKIFKFFKILLLDILLQTRILKTDFVRWIMHFCIFFGFTMLLLMHALSEIVTRPLFPEYYSTLDPFQFLRNLFGVMVLFGAAIAVFRRLRYSGPMLITRYADRYSVIILASIILSGFFVESSKLASEIVFNRMFNEFFTGNKPGDEAALKAYWSKQYGSVFPNAKFKITPELSVRGSQLNEESCSSCHSPARSAFISFPVARIIRPVAAPLNRARGDLWLYYLHVILCFIGLAYLPFSKFFHLIADPIALIVNGLADKKNVNPIAALPRRAVELDACTNCGTCSRFCSVAPVFRILQNTRILPMHKLRSVRQFSSGEQFSKAEMREISEGAFICTTCFKCTEVCPAGINLQDQWMSSRALLAEKGFPLPHTWIKDFTASEWSDRIRTSGAAGENAPSGKKPYYNLTGDSSVFAHCIQCQTCTNVCPVVAARTDPKEAVDITPHKIMNLLRLGLSELALGSRMTWDCTTCYQCQEHCPQEIKVADIIYELKNRAYGHFKKIDRDIQD